MDMCLKKKRPFDIDSLMSPDRAEETLDIEGNIRLHYLACFNRTTQFCPQKETKKPGKLWRYTERN